MTKFSFNYLTRIHALRPYPAARLFYKLRKKVLLCSLVCVFFLIFSDNKK